MDYEFRGSGFGVRSIQGASPLKEGVRYTYLTPKDPVQMQRLAILLLLSLVAPAQQPIAIHAGRLLDVRTGAARNSVYILIQDDKIAAVETSPPPAGVRV